METYLSQTIDIVNDNARYDTSVKEVLADKQVLARILKYSLTEFRDDDWLAMVDYMTVHRKDEVWVTFKDGSKIKAGL